MTATTERHYRGSKWIRTEKRLAIYIRDGFKCLHCGTDLKDADPTDVTLDHLECHSQGGSNEATNLVTCCRACNNGRGVKPWREYAPPGAHARILAAIATPINVKLAKALISDKTDWKD